MNIGWIFLLSGIVILAILAFMPQQRKEQARSDGESRTDGPLR